MNTLRVTAGSLRGRRVPVPPRDVRPTSERARQGFFNIVGASIAGARFLDLFAGTGIFAFEAVSRGAASATAVDRDRRSVEAIQKKATEWNAPVTAITGDVIARLPSLSGDIIYADPPYDYDQYDKLLEALDAPGRVVAIEHRKHSNPFTVRPASLTFDRRAEYGEVWITFFA